MRKNKPPVQHCDSLRKLLNCYLEPCTVAYNIKKHPELLLARDEAGRTLVHLFLSHLGRISITHAASTIRQVFYLMHQAIPTLAESPLNWTDDLGNVPLHYAVQQSYFHEIAEAFHYFLPKNINVQNQAGETPFLLACVSGNGLLAEWLVKLNADTTIPNHAHQSPLQACEQAYQFASTCLIAMNAPAILYVMQWLEGKRDHPYCTEKKMKPYVGLQVVSKSVKKKSTIKKGERK
ncbi:MAG: ankyrin repeat domain-containing protein [Gallionella sp.]